MNNEEHILELKDVKKSFYKNNWLAKKQETQVLKGVTFSILKGGTLALVGESGSGKSTTARLILGLETITDGEIGFKQTTLLPLGDKSQRELRKRMQVVFQDPLGSVNPRMKTWKIIGEPLLAEGTSKSAIIERAQDLLEKVGLNRSDAYKLPSEFSGGQLQRVSIARALALESELIILDEPTSALDISVQAKILKLLHQLQKELNLTYLFITHDLSVVKSFADRVLVMSEGEIVEEGTVKDVFENTTHPYTKKLLASNLL